MKSFNSSTKEFQKAVEIAAKSLAKKKDQEVIDLVLKEMSSAKVTPPKAPVDNALWKVTFKAKGIVDKNVTYTVLIIPDTFITEYFFNNPAETYFKKHLFRPEVAKGWVLLECMFLGSNVNPANHTINYVTKLCKECQSGLEK